MHNNKPVAWGWYDLEIKQFFPHWDEDLMENKEGCISLYTHPHPDNLGLAESIIKQQQLKIDNLLENNARLDAEIEALKSHTVKELTDEEIIDIWYEEQRQIVDFARAILRKAQEK